MRDSIRKEQDPKKALKKIRYYRRSNIVWVCFCVATLLVAGALLYLFVWSQPNQPDAPEDMVGAAPMPTPTAAPVPSQTVELVATMVPESTPKPLVMQEIFEELYTQNSDIVAWIAVPSTDIDYPIVQTGNNTDYLNRDFYGEICAAGTLFLDYRCDITNMYQAAHQIVYGHNMKNGTMFAALTNYADEEFFAQNRTISLKTLYGNYIFEVFAAYETPITFWYLEADFEDRAAWLKFIEVFADKSANKSDIVLSKNDVVLTLSTCTNEHDKNMRFVVHARLTDPELYDMDYEYIY